MKNRCTTCNKELSETRFTYYYLSNAGGEMLCEMCADKALRQWVETWGFVLALLKDFSTEKTDNVSHYG